MNLDIEIARQAEALPIQSVAMKLQINHDDIYPYGHDKAKLTPSCINKLSKNKNGKLILVTAISPTPAGEGKTTTSVGLNDALCQLNKKSIVCLREPSLGPCFGLKGGAAGGGYAQVIPMESINLHFTGDFHAITSAHNLLSAMIDNHIYWGNELRIDLRKITWKRVVDCNDRALREITIALGGVSNGFPRESGYDITVASEIMAIFCLAENLTDLQQRLGAIVIGYNFDNCMVTAKDLNADGAMTVLLKDAFMPNLVQTLENNPALIHGGPFANIAHGCNSVIATKAALKLSDYVITEAGFGADLGAEKFFNIKCRKANLFPDAVVIVATVRALKMHGGVIKAQLNEENIEAVKIGLANLERHIKNMKLYNTPIVVAINHFCSDTENEIKLIQQVVAELNVEAILCKHWAQGGLGAIALAEKVVQLTEHGFDQDATDQKSPLLYDDQLPLIDKIVKIATLQYGASDVTFEPKAKKMLNEWQVSGFGALPICIAKTPYSFSVDPSLMGAPLDHVLPVREVRLAAGAGFIVAICGAVMTMPGLPKTPAANHINIGDNGLIQGLF